jgi:hypothetical protein
VATADHVWGFAWGVRVARPVVDTGIVGGAVKAEPATGTSIVGDKGKSADEQITGGHKTSAEVLSMIFEVGLLAHILCTPTLIGTGRGAGYSPVFTGIHNQSPDSVTAVSASHPHDRATVSSRRARTLDPTGVFLLKFLRSFGPVSGDDRTF